ncbi:hypothetical protein SISSUDRAFT_566762 [Sistotremastrum suecicum HHB10207 ss-3]|uniref:Uncharacterized protein n=1 Tax=Sistotremastrum suecicum HHB10207 ss-3 TaxID=1314776 RepID=A0A165XJA2_9AGAM|nr:hypothetical protein SISSUDRAFT_566762 [Sistotremastrum suecicum HHB10207 ss-3]
MGTRIGVYIRWSIDVSPGEKIRLSTSVRSKRTEQIFDFFLRSALSLAKDVQVDVCSLRQVARTGLRVRTSLTLSINPSTVYYFAYSLNRNGSVPNPPGFWSFSPNPLCSDQQLQANTANVRFHMKPTVLYNRMNTHVLSLLQDIDSHGFVPIPDIIYASNPTFSAMSESSNSKPLPQPSRNVSNADRSHSFVQSPRQGRYHKCEMSKHCDRLLSIGYLLTASPRSIHSRNSPIV